MLYFEKLSEASTLNCGMIILTSGHEILDTIDDRSAGAHHSIFISSIVQILKALPGIMHVLREFEEIKKTDKNFTKNKNFGRDMFNVFVGIIWQMSLVVWPMYLLIKKWDGFMISIAVVIITTLLLKKFWYDNLKKEEGDLLGKRTVLSKEEYQKKADVLRKKVIDYQSQRRVALDKIATQRTESRKNCSICNFGKIHSPIH